MLFRSTERRFMNPVYWVGGWSVSKLSLKTVCFDLRATAPSIQTKMMFYRRLLYISQNKICKVFFVGLACSTVRRIISDPDCNCRVSAAVATGLLK